MVKSDLTSETSGPWHLRTANGRLPIVREIKRQPGEASHFEASVGAGNTLTGPIVAKLDFGYGYKGMEENARILGAAWQTCEALRELVDIVDTIRNGSPNQFYRRIDAVAKRGRAVLDSIDAEPQSAEASS